MSKNPKVIGEGSYGCIHRPSITCKNKKISYKKKVSKVLLNKYALKEMNQYLRIARADKKSHFYLGKPIQCEILNSKENIHALKGCEEGDNITENIDDYSLLVMPDGGIDIDIYVTKLKHMHKSNELTNRLRPFWIEFLRMFEGCELFLKHGIINHDIKPQNILYDEPNKRMNFIDFGLMQSYKKVTYKLYHSDYWLAKHAHWSYPLEIQFLNKNRYNHFIHKTEDEKREFYSRIIDDINHNNETYNSDTIRTLFSYIMPKENSDEFTNKYFDDLSRMLTTDINSKSYKCFIKKSLDTIDLYGVGFTVLHAINVLKNIIEKEFYHDLMEFTYKLITPRLYDRYTAKEATIKYKEILDKHGFYNKRKNIKTLKKSFQGIRARSLILSTKKRDKIIKKKVNIYNE